jgi:hypothetical protein
MDIINLTIPTRHALNMEEPILIINSTNVSYTTIIIYGLFILLFFIGIAVWLSTFKRGG